MNRSRERGFTLIELMVVIVIIGLLVGLVAVNPFRAVEDAREKTARAQMAMIDGAIQMYELNHRKLPSTLQELTQSDERGREAYLKRLSKDPWGTEYEYRVESHRQYLILSAGRNATFDDDDDLRHPDDEER